MNPFWKIIGGLPPIGSAQEGGGQWANAWDLEGGTPQRLRLDGDWLASVQEGVIHDEAIGGGERLAEFLGEALKPGGHRRGREVGSGLPGDGAGGRSVLGIGPPILSRPGQGLRVK